MLPHRDPVAVFLQGLVHHGRVTSERLPESAWNPRNVVGGSKLSAVLLLNDFEILKATVMLMGRCRAELIPIVSLDEPSTGADPASSCLRWRVIKHASMKSCSSSVMPTTT